MSFPGEYVAPAMGQPHVEGEARVHEFRAVRHFPVLREMASRTAHLGDGPLPAGTRSVVTRPFTPPKDPMLRTYGTKSESAVRRRRAHAGAGAGADRSDVSVHSQLSADGQGPQKPSLNRIQQLSRQSVLRPGATAMSRMQKSLIEARLQTKAEHMRELRLHQTQASQEKAAAMASPDPAVRASAKFTEVAALFDLQRDGAREGLAGFTGRKMNAHEFREQLKKSLGLRLDMQETIALIAMFDFNSDGLVEGVEFTNFFFRTALNAQSEDRLRRMGEVFQRKHQAQVDERDKHRQFVAANDAVIAIYSGLTLEQRRDKRRAFTEKLADIVTNWSVQCVEDKLGLDAFNCRMRPLEARLQLRRSFRVELTDEELSVFHHDMDTDGNGYIDGTEFQALFFRMRMARQERDRSARLRTWEKKEAELRAQFPDTYPFGKSLGR